MFAGSMLTTVAVVTQERTNERNQLSQDLWLRHQHHGSRLPQEAKTCAGGCVLPWHPRQCSTNLGLQIPLSTQLHVPHSKSRKTVEVRGGERPPPGCRCLRGRKKKEKNGKMERKVEEKILRSDLASATNQVCDEVSYVPRQASGSSSGH